MDFFASYSSWFLDEHHRKRTVVCKMLWIIWQYTVFWLWTSRKNILWWLSWCEFWRKKHLDVRANVTKLFTWKFVTFLNHFHENITFHLLVLLLLFCLLFEKNWEFWLHLGPRRPKRKPKCKQTSQFFKNQQK